jgi:hypothetical protein
MFACLRVSCASPLPVEAKRPGGGGRGEERGKSVERVGGRGGKRAQISAAGKLVSEGYRVLNLKRKKIEMFSVAGVVITG